MKAFAANSSDLGKSSTNPGGVWSHAFLALKLALDRGQEADTVIAALYAWLSYKRITPGEVDTILDMDADKAYEALVGMVSRQMQPQGLPQIVQDALRRAIQTIAGNYVTKQGRELKRQRARLSGIRSRFKLESAEALAARLLA